MSTDCRKSDQYQYIRCAFENCWEFAPNIINKQEDARMDIAFTKMRGSVGKITELLEE
jgi:hypothetical protein